MPVYQFSLLIEAAGTFLLLILFLILYQKIRRRAFLDWIASWSFLLVTLILRFMLPSLAEPRPFVFLLHLSLLAHVVFLLRGVRQFRDEKAVRGPMELLWIVPVFAFSWWTALEADKSSGASSAAIGLRSEGR